VITTFLRNRLHSVVESVRASRSVQRVREKMLCRAAVRWRQRSLEHRYELDGEEAMRLIDRDLLRAIERYTSVRPAGATWHRPTGSDVWTCSEFPLEATVRPWKGDDLGGWEWFVALDANGWCATREGAMRRAELVAIALCEPTR